MSQVYIKKTNFGRINLPIEIRRELNLMKDCEIELYSENEKIIIKRHNKICDFCNGTTNIKEYMNKKICSSCLNNILSLNNKK